MTKGQNHCKILLISRQESNLYQRFFLCIFLLVVGATWLTGFNPIATLSDQAYFWQFLRDDFFPPKVTKVPELLQAILTTLQIAFGATFVATIIAAILAPFGSLATTPLPILPKLIRGFASIFRNIPALVWALLLFMSFGVGTGVGFLAIFIQTLGFLLRAFIEIIDEVGAAALEATTASGATFAQKIFQVVLPSCLIGYVSWFLYSLELNIRSSTIVGMVGGGGVGMVIFAYIKSFKYDVAAGIIIAVALLIIGFDGLTQYLRRKVLM